MMRSYKKQLAVFVGCCVVIGLTATLVPAAKPTPPPPPALVVALAPPPLNQVVAPDMNKLGLLDCTGPGLAPDTCGAQYPGLPITKAQDPSTSIKSGPTGFKTTGPFAGFPNDPNHPRNKLVALGKALFWDMQVGSDGIQACATCHYHAGADNRYQNQTTPALNRVGGTQAQIKAALNPNQLVPPNLSNPADSAITPAPNGVLTPKYFPVPFNTARNAAPDFGNNDTRSSQGVHGRIYTPQQNPIPPVEGSTSDSSVPLFDNANVRRVEPRNTPSTHAAVYNLRQFWDGRANLFFNGVNPFGMLDPDVRVKMVTSGIITDQQLMIPYSSLASQAVGPPLSGFEMSFGGRSFQNVGHKLLALKPLARQQVSPTDSVLGPYADVQINGYGLTVSYAGLIKDVFQEKFWKVDIDGTDLSLMEQNFALFFGLAIQAYEATLIPDGTPFDTLLARLNQTRPNPTSTDQLERGLAVFLSTQAKCSVCHVGAETTGASVSLLTKFGQPVLVPDPAAVPEVFGLVERMPMGDGTTALYDTGFYNVGIRPTKDDLGIFGRANTTQEPTLLTGVPFSFGLLVEDSLSGSSPAQAVYYGLMPSLKLPSSPTDLTGQPFGITVGCLNPPPGGCLPIQLGDPLVIRGAFKAPPLRNVAFTGPYFHTGAMKNLNEVLSFYNLGGRFNLAFDPDGCGTSTPPDCIKGQVDFDPAIGVLGLTTTQLADLQFLLQVGMVDRRVQYEQAPFDHPQICVPHGQSATGDILRNIPMSNGSNGNNVPILTFEQTMTTGATGKHDHNLATGCAMSLP